MWLTETGGIVARNNNSRVAPAGSTAHAAKATRFVFEKLVRVDPRIKRVYLYHWNDQPGPRSWDSALVAANGRRARPTTCSAIACGGCGSRAISRSVARVSARRRHNLAHGASPRGARECR